MPPAHDTPNWMLDPPEDPREEPDPEDVINRELDRLEDQIERERY